jgi:putative spermidine/putrescine transport system ATP-binding protein
MDCLAVDSINYERPGFSLDLDLRLGEGELGVLLGPSGCGKSTALRMVAGLVPPRSGRIFLKGRDITGLPPEKRKVGLVFQDFALFGQLSARKNIEYGPRIAGRGRLERKAISDSLAASFHMGGFIERLPQTLSGGEQQRVALARSLAARPELLLLDEPLSSLDAALRRELREEIRGRVKEAGIAALHVTHDVEEALALADRIFVMRGGRIIESSEAEAIYARPASAFTARLMGSGPLIPVSGMKAEGGFVLAATAFGNFSCPPPPNPSGGKDAPAFIHFNHESVSLLPRGSDALPPGFNLIEGKVLSSTYLGRKKLVILEAPAGAKSQAPAIELELAPSERPVSGSVIRLAVPVEGSFVLY